jgi:hypothetical protein
MRLILYPPLSVSLSLSLSLSLSIFIQVDPFSTGAHLAAMVLKWGFKLVLVFSAQDDHGSSSSRVFADVEGGNKASSMRPTLLVQHRLEIDR